MTDNRRPTTIFVLFILFLVFLYMMIFVEFDKFFFIFAIITGLGTIYESVQHYIEKRHNKLK
jgi:hypothetical protein